MMCLMPRVTYLNESRIVTRVANFIFIDTESGKPLLDFFEHLQNYKQHTPYSLLHLIVLLLYDNRSALIPRFKVKWVISEFQSAAKCEAIDMKMNYSRANKTHFHKKGFTFGFVLKIRVLRTRKQPIECFHSRGEHLCKFIETKESVCIRKEFNSHRIGLGHQHVRLFIVLGHQYGRRDVM